MKLKIDYVFVRFLPQERRSLRRLKVMEEVNGAHEKDFTVD